MNQAQFQEHINGFFKLYEQFLLVDSIVAVLATGRNRELAAKFLAYFTSIVNDKNDPNQEQNIQSHKNGTKALLRQYISHHALIQNKCNNAEPSSHYASMVTQKIDNDLNNSFRAFLKAARMYELHRAKLSNNDILEIYKRNAFDYYVTAFGTTLQDEFKASMEQYTASKKLNGVQMLKQSIMEFNNAIAHIYSAWRTSSIEKNMERAQHHLNRGALDFYKSIIKELSILNKIDEPKIKKLKELRCSEYNSIGQERHKTSYRFKSLYDEYYNFCSDVLN